MDDALPTPTPVPRKHFYADVVDDPAALIEARELEGIDAEIDLLRARFREYLRAHPRAYSALLKSIELIVRAVAARYRMSPQRTAQFSASLEQTLRQFADVVLPERVTDV